MIKEKLAALVGNPDLMEESEEKKKQGMDRSYFSVQLFFLIFICSVILSLMAVTIFCTAIHCYRTGHVQERTMSQKSNGGQPTLNSGGRNYEKDSWKIISNYVPPYSPQLFSSSATGNPVVGLNNRKR